MPIGTERHFLRKDFSLECGSEMWTSFLIMPLILVIGFAFSIPLLLGSYIFLHRNNLHAPATRQRIGFLYPRYQPGTEGWEIFEVVRKLCLTGKTIFWECIRQHCVKQYFNSHVCVFSSCQVY